MMALAQCPNVNVKLSGLGTFVHACRADVMDPVISETVAMFGGGSLLLRQQFSDRKALDRLHYALQDVS
jgi:hypothetical protein